VNYEAVCKYLASHVPGADRGPLRFQLIGDGRSNLSYLVSGPGGRWVMRRPPLGHVLPTAHDMAREFRVQSALRDTDVPVPGQFALCEDLAVNGSPFYVMEYCEGVIIGEQRPAGFAETLDERRRLSLALVDVLVRLHAVDIHAVGLSGFAFKPEGYLERQVRRWGEQWERSKTREIDGIDELARRLKAALPPVSDVTIVHGDYRMGNVILAPGDPGRIVAVLDWEMATLGDPLADVAWMIGYWGNVGDPAQRLHVRPTAHVTAVPGFLTREELVAEYGRRSGRDVSRLDFHQAFMWYKAAVISEGIYTRYLQGKTLGEGFERSGLYAPAAVAVGLQIAGASYIPALRGEA
jgi:aminoglycoside phosphotransferase (APT) family kinase protein